MFEIDKEQFGVFVAARRKEQQLTQKELAQRLLISDKAVSKWERGLSMPDVQLLIPLAEQLNVTVTELLECQQVPQQEAMDAEQVEALVQKTIHLSEGQQQKNQQRRRKGLVLLGLTAVIVCMELALLVLSGRLTVQNGEDIFTLEILCAVFGVYFFLFSKDTLPAYYDTNKISTYSDGVFRMNLAGVSFNNSNWPKIMQVCRCWTVLTAVLMPVGYSLLWSMNKWFHYGIAILLVVSLFVPVYAVAKKYE